MEGTNKERLSNLELLRIISMILIVSSHYVIHASEFVDGLIVNKYIYIKFYSFRWEDRCKLFYFDNRILFSEI